MCRVLFSERPVNVFHVQLLVVLYRVLCYLVVEQAGGPSLAASTSGARLHTLALPNLNGRLVVDGGCSHAFLDLARHCQEGLFDV
jgi:hypothetical protein